MKKFIIESIEGVFLKGQGYLNEVRSNIPTLFPPGLVTKANANSVAIIDYISNSEIKDNANPVCIGISNDPSIVPIPTDGELILYAPDTGQIKFSIKDEVVTVFGNVKFKDDVVFEDNVTFKNNTTFESKSTFEDNVDFESKVEFKSDAIYRDKKIAVHGDGLDEHGRIVAS